MLDDGQPEAMPPLFPAPPFIHPVEPLEDPRQALGRNPRAVVPHRHHHPFRFRHGGHLHLPPGGGVLDGVVQEVDEDLFDTAGLDEHRRQSLEAGHCDRGAPLRGLGFQEGHGPPRRPFQVEGEQVEGELVGLQFRQGQQVADEFGLALDMVPDDLDEADGTLRVLRSPARPGAPRRTP